METFRKAFLAVPKLEGDPIPDNPCGTLHTGVSPGWPQRSIKAFLLILGIKYGFSDFGVLSWGIWQLGRKVREIGTCLTPGS